MRATQAALFSDVMGLQEEFDRVMQSGRRLFLPRSFFCNEREWREQNGVTGAEEESSDPEERRE